MRRLATRVLQPFPRGDRAGAALLAVVAVMVGFGTVMVGSASDAQSALSGGTSFALAIRDVIFLGLGLIVFWVAARVRLAWVVSLAPTLILGGLGLLVAVEAVGITVNGAKRWLPTPIIQIQPSEFFKLFVVLYVVWVVERHHRRIGQWQHLALWMSPVAVGVGLILLEHDVGTDTVVGVIALSILFVAGISRRVAVGIAASAIPVVGIYALVEPYSMARLTSFLHPNANLSTTGYQLWQSRIGLGAGGLTGLGLDHSREKWGLLPNPHTDFIFTIIGEELGLIGTLAVLALFIAFMFASVHIAQRCTNSVYRLMAIGIATWIAVEALINIASVVGWWAVTGIPLPFFSYGGTALITELFAVGLLYNIAHDKSHSGDVTIREHRITNFRETIERSTSHPTRSRGKTPRAER